MVLMPNRMHAPPTRPLRRRGWQLLTSAAAVPGLDGLLSYGAGLVFRPEWGVRLSSRANPAAADLRAPRLRRRPRQLEPRPLVGQVRPSLAARARRRSCWTLYPRLRMPVLLLWADQDRIHPLSAAEEALALLGDGHLRVLPSCGFLMAYDDPVGLARELAAFCG